MFSEGVYSGQWNVDSGMWTVDCGLPIHPVCVCVCTIILQYRYLIPYCTELQKNEQCSFKHTSAFSMGDACYITFATVRL
jgi:hypothetical protein